MDTAFLTLGFILAFPVIGLEKLGSWRNLGYTQDQITLFVLSFVEGWICPDRNGCCDGGRIYECSKWIPVSVFQKENGFLSQSSNETVRTFCRKGSNGTDLLSGAIYRYRISDSLCWGSEGAFQLEFMGMAVKMLCLHLLVYLMIYFSVVLVLCITGNMLMGILTLGGMYLYGIALELVLVACGLTFLDTFIDKRYGIMHFF